ncbi:hypothetical protein JTB14_027981 [Gonioctena quinquepunctata]|nr:hypothetical protein JTB14_027981 [Gonioctena quinquepunctata]
MVRPRKHFPDRVTLLVSRQITCDLFGYGEFSQQLPLLKTTHCVLEIVPLESNHWNGNQGCVIGIEEDSYVLALRNITGVQGIEYRR